MLSGILIYLSLLYALLHVSMQIKKNELSSVVRIYDLRSVMSVVLLVLQFSLVWAFLWEVPPLSPIIKIVKPITTQKSSVLLDHPPIPHLPPTSEDRKKVAFDLFQIIFTGKAPYTCSCYSHC